MALAITIILAEMAKAVGIVVGDGFCLNSELVDGINS
jgi:hypothetical protein